MAWRLLPALLSISLAFPVQGAEPSGPELIDTFLAGQDVPSEMALVRMQFLQNGVRVNERRLLMLYQKAEDGTVDYLVRLVRPKDVEGVTLLAAVDPKEGMKQSIFLPSIGKTRPLTSDAQFSPFLGSDFAYADLVQEIPGTQRYERIEDDHAQGLPCHVVRATPLDKSSAYGFRKLYLELESNNLLRVDYYDTDGDLIKVLECFDYGSSKIHGKTIRPFRSVMSVPSKGSSTVFTVLAGRVGEDFPPDVFKADFVENWTSDEVIDFIFRFRLEVTGSTD